MQKKPKYLFNNGLIKEALNINSYLIDSKNIYIKSLTNSISNFPKMNFGNMPADNGLLLFTENEKREFISKEPSSEKYFKNFISANEFLNGSDRFCLWLEDVDYNSIPLIKERVDKLREVRLNSSRPQLASIPHLFAQITQPINQDFILIPRHSSERRDYIPIGYFDKSNVSADSCLIVATQNIWLFGVLTSKIHMIWIKNIGGKLEERLRYSAGLCYNAFPFPTISDKQKETINLHVFEVLDERAKYPEKTLAQLYDPDKMPKGLKEAHHQLDLAIERCYRLKPFESDVERLEYLFKMYEEMTTKDSLFAKEKKSKKAK